MTALDPGASVGERIKHHRRRVGMTRTVLGGLVDRSAEWVKAVENGRLQTPRLSMLLRIARALDIADLSDLTGDGHAVPVHVFVGEGHPALGAVQAALTAYPFTAPATAPNMAHLELRLDQAWRVRHASPDHRTQLAALLPSLITDARAAVRSATGAQRRQARLVLAGVYRLADFYVAFQPAPELVWLVADRAVAEGQEADDPYAIAAGAWVLVQALREAGRWDEAITVALDAAGQIEPHLPGADDDWRAIWGALLFEVAYTHARRGRQGDAWAHFERADRAARQLGAHYRHVQTSFSQTIMGAHATTLGVELRRPGEAMRAADSFDASQIPSLPRRSRHLIEVARAHHQRGEQHATYALLDQAERTAPETIRYNGFGRDMLLHLAASPPSGMRAEVRQLCDRVGLVV
jgi:transcriptional regulator with XRE-family HTH domain